MENQLLEQSLDHIYPAKPSIGERMNNNVIQHPAAEVRTRAIGAMLGLAVGDAVGGVISSGLRGHVTSYQSGNLKKLINF